MRGKEASSAGSLCHVRTNAKRTADSEMVKPAEAGWARPWQFRPPRRAVSVARTGRGALRKRRTGSAAVILGRVIVQDILCAKKGRSGRRAGAVILEMQHAEPGVEKFLMSGRHRFIGRPTINVPHCSSAARQEGLAGSNPYAVFCPRRGDTQPGIRVRTTVYL